MTEKSSGWSQGTVGTPVDKLVEVAEKLNEMARLGLAEKLSQLRVHVRAEAKKHNHPLMDELLKKIDDIKIT